jgi:hypothetical protein
LDLQRLDPLLGGCGGPVGVSRDGRHGAIASRTHPWEGGTGGEIDRIVWLAPPNSDMEFGSGTMTITPYIICYFNGPFLVACPRVLEIVEPALLAPRCRHVRGDALQCSTVGRRRDVPFPLLPTPVPWSRRQARPPMSAMSSTCGGSRGRGRQGWTVVVDVEESSSLMSPSKYGSQKR